MNHQINECKHFEQLLLEVLNKHVPIKMEVFRKTVVKSLELENKYVKNEMKTLNLIKKQRNFCSKLYKKERINHSEKLDLKNVTGNKGVLENC